MNDKIKTNENENTMLKMIVYLNDDKNIILLKRISNIKIFILYRIYMKSKIVSTKGGQVECCDNIEKRLNTIYCDTIMLSIRLQLNNDEDIYIHNIKDKLEELKKILILEEYNKFENEVNSIIRSNRLKKFISFLEITVPFLSVYILNFIKISKDTTPNFTNLFIKARNMKNTISTKMANYIENGLGGVGWTLENHQQLGDVAHAVSSTIIGGGGDNNEIKKMAEDYISMSKESIALRIEGISLDLLNRYNMLLHQFTIYVLLLDMYDKKNGTDVLNGLIKMQKNISGSSVKPVKGGKKKTSENYNDIIIKCLNKCIKIKK